MGPYPLSGVHRWQGLQRRIGLTGGIASGKSSVGRFLEQQGIAVLDADLYAHEALAPDTPTTRAVLARYGAKVQSALSNGLDRAALGSLNCTRWYDNVSTRSCRRMLARESWH